MMKLTSTLRTLLTRHRWLTGSACLWLLCAWVARHPGEPIPSTNNFTGAVPADTTQSPVRQDPESGLAIDPNLLLVKGQCTACHSSKLILQSHFTREKWIERIRWMQRTQKLWDLGEAEPAILAYLTKYYGPIDTPFDGRRLPLSAPRWYRQ